MANEYIVINDDLRTMQIPSSITILGVESDDDVNKIPFQMPKEYCGFDLSTFEARINYMNANGIGDMYIVDDLAVDGDDPSLMTFTWLVGRNACAYKGNTKFIVCLKKFDNDDNVVQEFNTTVYNLPVLEGLETTDAVEQQNADVIEQILTMIQEAGVVDLSNYYTKAEVNALKLPNPYPLTINGTSYDGSQAVELDIEGGTSQTTEIADGQIIHVTDAVANEAVKALTLYDSNNNEVSSAVIAVTNKNLFRLDQIASQTVSKGITFEKNSDGAIHATGTSTGTYAAAQAAIDKNAFVVGETYTISSGKTSGVLYVQLILNYEDGTTDYLVSSNQPYTFTLQKEVSSVTGSVQLTSSGVTVDEWIYPMIELSDMASSFVMNTYSSMTFDGTTMPTLPDSISNVWSNTDTVENIVMEYWNDPVMAKVNELEKEINSMVDENLDSTSENAVKNKTVTTALMAKLDSPESGTSGQVLTKTETGHAWMNKGYVTPQMFGAKGDGVTDDSLAIQSAIDYLYQNNGGILYFPEGTYLRSSQINSYPNISFIGCAKKSVIKTNAFNIPFVLANDNTIDSLTFDGNHRELGDEDQTLNTTVYPMGKRIVIQNSYFLDSVGSNISSAGGEDIVIKNNTFDGYKDHAIYFTTTNSKNIIVNGNIIHGNSAGADAIKFRTGPKDITIVNNICDNVVRFLNLTAEANPCENILIAFNDVETLNSAVLFYRTSSERNTNVIIKSNTFKSLGTTGAIYLIWNGNCGAKEVTIEGNTFKDFTTLGTMNGDSSYLLEDVAFTNNTFINNESETDTSAAFNFSKVKNLRFENNTIIILNYRSVVFYIGSSTELKIVGNVFRLKDSTSLLLNLNNASDVKIEFKQNTVSKLVQRPIYKGAITGNSLCVISDNNFAYFGQAYFYDLTACDSSKYMVRDNVVNGVYYMYDVTSYAPSYLGQIAVKSGIAYIATGTSSVSDWKAFTS